MGSDAIDRPEAQRYRVLSLDGGGVKGAYTASVLHTLEIVTGKSISDHFDLITGTSTGGIIAIGIGLGVPLAKILDFYVQKGRVIFPHPSPGYRGQIADFLRHSMRPKHSKEVLRATLKAVLKDSVLGESKNRLVIPAFNAVSGDIQLFKTAHCPAYRMDYLRPALDVALATSAAPTFFSAHTDGEGRVYIDGGVWANCPAMVGLMEATAVLGWPIDQIDLLSIGTTFAPFDISHKRRNGGLVHWNKGLIDLFQEAQVKGTLGLASAMTKKSMLRIDAVTRGGRFSLDGAREVLDLKALGENCGRKWAEEVQNRFFDTPCAPFEAIYAPAAKIQTP